MKWTRDVPTQRNAYYWYKSDGGGIPHMVWMTDDGLFCLIPPNAVPLWMPYGVVGMWSSEPIPEPEEGEQDV